jgi:hypothetical protein
MFQAIAKKVGLNPTHWTRLVVSIAQAGHEAQHRRDGCGEGQALQGFGQILSYRAELGKCQLDA